MVAVPTDVSPRRRPHRLLAAIAAVAALVLPAVSAQAAPVQAGRRPVARPQASGPGRMPTGNPRGYRRVFADSFNRASLGPNWVAYQGKPGGDAVGWWSPSHAVVRDGELQLETYKDRAHYGGPRWFGPWVEAGVTSAPVLKQAYGEYLVRSRSSAAGAVDDAELLWPSNGTWPPEIDIAEWSGRAHQAAATVHWGRTNADRSVHIRSGIDLTQWHTWGVVWTPTRVSYTLDGKVWATVARHVPKTKMVLDLQQEMWRCGNDEDNGCPTTSTPRRMNLDVAWVVAYARRS